MNTFFIKLIPPRPNFAGDMSAKEAEAMRAHAFYWREQMDRGKVVAFGPVADPAGTYGIGIVQVAAEAEARHFMENDPAIRANLGLLYEIHPMPQGVIHRVG